MDKHTLAGLVIAVAVVMFAALFYEGDVRMWRERARQRRRQRQRQRAKDRGDD